MLMFMLTIPWRWSRRIRKTGWTWKSELLNFVSSFFSTVMIQPWCSQESWSRDTVFEQICKHQASNVSILLLRELKCVSVIVWRYEEDFPNFPSGSAPVFSAPHAHSPPTTPRTTCHHQDQSSRSNTLKLKLISVPDIHHFSVVSRDIYSLFMCPVERESRLSGPRSSRFT